MRRQLIFFTGAFGLVTLYLSREFVGLDYLFRNTPMGQDQWLNAHGALWAWVLLLGLIVGWGTSRIFCKKNSALKRESLATLFLIGMGLMLYSIAANTRIAKMTNQVTKSVVFEKQWMIVLLFFLVLAFGIIAYFSWINRRLWMPSRWVEFFLLPLSLVPVAFVVNELGLVPRIRAVKPELSVKPHTQSHERTVVIILDELSRGVLIEEIQNGTRWPNLRKLRATSWRATNANSPGNATLISVMGFLTGREFTRVCMGATSGPVAWENNIGSLRIMKEGGYLFDRLAESGMKSGIIGWMFPYCSLFQNSSSRCFSQGVGLADYAESFRGSFAAIGSRIPRLNWTSEEMHTERYQRIKANAIDMILDPSLNFVWAHFPIPHLPVVLPYHGSAVFDAKGVRSFDGYLSNLDKADELIGEIIAGLEKSGLQNKTHLILTSDHSLHEWAATEPIVGKIFNDKRVPLWIRPAGPVTDPESYEPQINTRSLYHLFLERDQHLKTKRDISAWFDKNRDRVSNQRMIEDGNCKTEE